MEGLLGKLFRVRSIVGGSASASANVLERAVKAGRLDEGLAELLRGMLEDKSKPAYAAAAQAAITGLEDGTLAGLVRSSARARVTKRLGFAPAACAGGAHFQNGFTRKKPRDERDLPGIVVVADDYAGGAMVLAHELTHYRVRFVVHELRSEPAPLLADAAECRSRYLNEVAARHTAYLGNDAIAPSRTHLPVGGAFFACAVLIAGYPEIYQDETVLKPIVDAGDDGRLRDIVGAWLPALARFAPWFERGSADAVIHRAWLEQEIDLARQGRHAPRVPTEGTL